MPALRQHTCLLSIVNHQGNSSIYNLLLYNSESRTFTFLLCLSKKAVAPSSLSYSYLLPSSCVCLLEMSTLSLRKLSEAIMELVSCFLSTIDYLFNKEIWPGGAPFPAGYTLDCQVQCLTTTEDAEDIYLFGNDDRLANWIWHYPGLSQNSPDGSDQR